MGKTWFSPGYSPEALRIAIYYLIFSTLWILLSDQIILLLFNDIESLSTAQTYKGWFFIAVTSLVILLLLEREFKKYRGTEASLRASEDYLSSIFRAAPIGMGVVSNRTFLSVNDRLCSMTGYSREELLGKNSRMLYANDEDFEFVGREKYQEIHDSGTGTVETRWQHKDGHLIDVLLSSTPINREDLLAGVTFTALDITERNRATAALKESENKFALAFTASPDAVNINRLEDGLYVEINKGFTDLTGYTHEDVVGKSSKDINLWYDLSDRDHLVNSLKTKGYCENLEAKFRRKDGSITTALMSARIIPLHNVPHIISITRDIGELKRVEQEVLAQKKMFETMFNAITDGIVITDTHRQILLANKGMTTTFGYTPGELIGKTTEILYDNTNNYLMTGEAVFNSQSAHPTELYTTSYKDKTGRIFPGETFGTKLYDNNDQWIGNLGVMRDITKRKQDEDALERLKVAIEQAGEVIVVTDTDGIIEYTNPAFEKVTGYSLDEVHLQNPRILKSGLQDELFYKNLWQTISSGRTWAGRLVNKHKNGSLFTEEATISPVFNNEGQIINYVAIKRDITTQLKLEAQYLQAQKMESVGRLTGGVAHDFNNILAVILGYTELAMRQVGPSEKLYSDLEKIFDAANRSADIVRQLLAFSRKQNIAPKVLDLNDTVAGMLRILNRLIGEDIELSWNPMAHPATVKMDPSQVDQILANLCVNARDAIDGNGKVTIETDNTSLDEEYCASHLGFQPGKYVTLSVSDNGCGFDKDIADNIFEPFFTTKGMLGTGLGLSTVYGIVKQNDGIINVYSEPGKGTTFKIYLPMHENMSIWQAEAEPLNPELSHGETILLVEDDQSILEMAAIMLERLNYKVLKANTPKEALQQAKEHTDVIHLLITDVIMPEMNGKELANRLVALSPKLKVLYISGYTANVIAHHGILEDGIHFLQKPFSRREMASKIREVLDREIH
jgi:PAS domain S-box-containing protein